MDEQKHKKLNNLIKNYMAVMGEGHSNTLRKTSFAGVFTGCEELKPGIILKFYNAREPLEFNKSNMAIATTSLDEKGWFQYILVEPHKGEAYEIKASARDAGIIPYEYGWSPTSTTFSLGDKAKMLHLKDINDSPKDLDFELRLMNFLKNEGESSLVLGKPNDDNILQYDKLVMVASDDNIEDFLRNVDIGDEYTFGKVTHSDLKNDSGYFEGVAIFKNLNQVYGSHTLN